MEWTLYNRQHVWTLEIDDRSIGRFVEQSCPVNYTIQEFVYGGMNDQNNFQTNIPMDSFKSLILLMIKNGIIRRVNKYGDL